MLQLLRGKKSMAQLLREHSIAHDVLDQRRNLFLERGRLLFAPQPAIPTPAARIDELDRLAVQQSLELAVGDKATRWRTSPPRSDES